MSSINKILVGIDFNVSSATALDEAMTVARKAGAEIVLLHASALPEHLPPEFVDLVGAAAERPGLAAAQLAHTRAELAEVRRAREGQGVAISTMVIDEYADTGLARAAAELGAELVVIGSGARERTGRIPLGGVACRVVRSTRSAVLVSRGGAFAGGYRRVLVATDFSATAAIALDRALDLAADSARIEVVYAFDTSTIAPAVMPAKVFEAARQRADVLGQEFIARRDAATLQLSFTVVEGRPAAVVLERLEAGAFDLVALGSHGLRGWRRLVLGSVAERVARRAPCSVLVTHPPAGTDYDGTASAG